MFDPASTSSVLICAVSESQDRRATLRLIFLVDAVLRRLAPSLERHKGCTIIDINPGFGLWSSKLHEWLKPRRHVLAESHKPLYSTSLSPLVDQPGSRYTLVDWEDKYVWQPDRYIAEGLLPSRDSSQPRGLNDSILIVANLAIATSVISERPRGAKSHHKLLDFAHEIRNLSGFHGGGPVRLLMWLPEREKTAILPRTIRSRKKLALEMEMTCYVQEVVSCGITVNTKQQMRDPAVDLMSGRQVASRTDAEGIKLPKEREGEPESQLQVVLSTSESIDPRKQLNSKTIHVRGWHKELLSLQQQFQEGKFSQLVGGRPGERIQRPRSKNFTPEFDRMVTLERNLRSAQRKSGFVERLLQEQAEIDLLAWDAHDPNLEDSKRMAKRVEYEKRKKQLKERLDNLPSQDMLNQFEFFKNDRKAFAQTPPLLLWDQRTTEPMIAQQQEFYPKKGMCLLDIQPKFPLPYPIASTEESAFDLIMTKLFQNGANNLTVLDNLAPGAFQAIVQRVKALQDPRMGGERDIRDLQICRLTPEMARQIALAWEQWPFKPGLAELLSGSSGPEDDMALKPSHEA